MLKTCGKLECQPEQHGENIRCSTCGWAESVKHWDYQMQIARDNLFDNIATLQWNHNKRPFFVGKPKDGFWVKDGRKYLEYPGDDWNKGK